MTKFLITIVIVLCCGRNINAQFHPQQSLYTYNPLPINGAAAGKDNALNVVLSHRTMWKGISGAPKTQYVALNMPLKKENFAVGLQIMNDKIGVSQRIGVFVTGAYRLQLSKEGKLAFGITGGLFSNNNRWSDVVTTYEGDRVFDSGDMSYMTPNAGASVFYHDKKMFAGFSVPHLLTETYAGSGRYKATHEFSNYNYHLMSGRLFSISNKMYVKPSVLMKYHARSGMQLDLTSAFGNKSIGEVGITIRPKQSMVMFLQAKVNGQLSIAYSYDHLLGTLSKYDNGTHEVALMYTFIYQSNAPNTRFF